MAYDEKVRARAIKLLAGGQTHATVAAALKIPRGTLGKWAIAARDEVAAPRKPGPPPSLDMAKAARAYAMREKGAPIGKVAEKYGVSTATIYEWFKRVRVAKGMPPARSSPGTANGHAKDTARRAAVGLDTDNGHAVAATPADRMLAAALGTDMVLAPRTIVGGPSGDLPRQVRALTLERDALRRIVDELTK
jgi:transposase-like protein